MFDANLITDTFAERINEGMAIFREACYTLARNQECYIAQWILQNPNVNIDDYAIVNRPTEDGLGYITTLELKSNVIQ